MSASSIGRIRHYPMLLIAILMMSGVEGAWAQNAHGKENPRAGTPAGTPAATNTAAGKRQARFMPTAWEVRCLAVQAGKQARCTLRRAIVELRSRQTLLGISLSGDRKRLELLLPHGLDLRQPTEVLVDGKPLGKASYITSRPRGLFARMPVQPAQLKRMAAGKQMAVRARVLNGKPLVIRTGLEGFAAALAKLR